MLLSSQSLKARRLLSGLIVLFFTGCGSSSDPGSNSGGESSTSHTDTGVGENRPSSSGSGRDLQIHLEPYLETCDSNPRLLCLVGSYDQATYFEIPYDGIKGLRWQWGRRFVIVARQQGTAIYPFQLVRVLQETPEDMSYGFMIDVAPASIATLSGCTFQLGGQVRFGTFSNPVCSDLKRAVRTGKTVLAEFSFTGQAAQPIQLEAISNAEGDHVGLTSTETSF